MAFLFGAPNGKKKAKQKPESPGDGPGPLGYLFNAVRSEFVCIELGQRYKVFCLLVPLLVPDIYSVVPNLVPWYR